MKKEIFIPNEIQDIITALTAPINIISIVENSGVSTITTDTIRIFDNLCDTMNLQDGMIVTINSVNYQVSNVTHTVTADTFDITGINIPVTEWCIALNYETGSRTEINQILNRDSGDLDRFPLLWLIPTTDLDYDNPVLEFSADIVLVFAHKANNTDYTSIRYDNSIEPVIQPLITLFNLWLQSSDFNYMLEFNGYGKPINQKKSIYPFYGTSDKTESVLNVVTDAIEIDYTLKFKKQYEY